jgi:hypothetical protein
MTEVSPIEKQNIASTPTQQLIDFNAHRCTGNGLKEYETSVTQVRKTFHDYEVMTGQHHDVSDATVFCSAVRAEISKRTK